MTSLTAQTAALASAPASKLSAVTTSDTVDLTLGVCRALWIGAAGNVAVLAEDDLAAVTLLGATAGQIIPIRARRVFATGTTAASIVAIY